MNTKKLGFFLVIGIIFFSTAFSVTAATAAGLSGLSSIEALIWDLFSVMVPIAIALAVLGILALAVPGIRKFLGGLV